MNIMPSFGFVETRNSDGDRTRRLTRISSYDPSNAQLLKPSPNSQVLDRSSSSGKSPVHLASRPLPCETETVRSST